MYLDDSAKRSLIRQYFKHRRLIEEYSDCEEDTEILNPNYWKQVIFQFLDECFEDLCASIIRRRPLSFKGICLIVILLCLAIIGWSITKEIRTLIKSILFINVVFLILALLIVIYLLPKLKIRKIIYRLYRYYYNPEPPVTDEQIIRWLNEDIYGLIHRGLIELNIDDMGHLEQVKNKLKISNLEDNDFEELYEYPKNYRGKVNLLLNTPIYLKSGCDAKSYSSMIQVDNTRLESDKQRRLISLDDFKSVKTLDGRKRIYGVYEFIVIFLCKNFLSYYRCYWNFMRGVSVDDEICEYLYDSIASVKIRERASSNDSSVKKRVYREFLSITTTDGREVEFKIEEPKKISSDYWYSSNARSAAQAIRRMLRQRRIDVVKVEQNET